MAENVNPKAGPGSGLVIAIIGLVVLLILIFYYWMGAWRDTGGALDPHPPAEPHMEQQPTTR